MAKTTVLVTGASGNIGKAALSALASYADSIDVKAGSRDPAKSASLAELAPNVTVVAADGPSLPAALAGVDYVFLVTPGSEDRTQIAMSIVDAAKAAGIKFILVISVLTAEEKGTVFGDQFAPLEAHVKSSGVPFCLLRLPLFLDNFWGQAGAIKNVGQFYYPTSPDKPFVAVAVSDVAAAAAKILSDPTPHFGKTYKLSSPPVTHAEVAEAFTAVLGKPVTYIQVPYEAQAAALKDMGFQDWQVTGIAELYKFIEADSPVTKDREGPVHFEQITGKPATSTKDWIAGVAKTGAF